MKAKMAWPELEVGGLSDVGTGDHRLCLVPVHVPLRRGELIPWASRSSTLTVQSAASSLSVGHGVEDVPLQDEDDQDVDALQHVHHIHHVPVEIDRKISDYRHIPQTVPNIDAVSKWKS